MASAGCDGRHRRLSPPRFLVRRRRASRSPCDLEPAYVATTNLPGCLRSHLRRSPRPRRSGRNLASQAKLALLACLSPSELDDPARAISFRQPPGWNRPDPPVEFGRPSRWPSLAPARTSALTPWIERATRW